ncbi:hypothetical protein [Ornithinimicrobium kibberense]
MPARSCVHHGRPVRHGAAGFGSVLARAAVPPYGAWSWERSCDAGG